MIFGILVVIIAITEGKYGYHVEFFDGKDFDGSFFENSPGPNCVNFSSFSTEMSNRASSLKTDVCIMVYENTDCEWRLNHSVKIPPGEHPDLAVFHHSKVNFDNKIGSFKVCAQDQWGGGDIHNVYLSGTTDRLATYNDFCECVTVPEYMHGKISYVDNYGNCIRLYSRENCQGDSVDINGGNSDEARNLDVVNFNGLTKSFSVCGDSTMCTRFSAEVIEFEVFSSPSKRKDTMFRNVELSERTTYRNNGGGSVTEDFAAENTVTANMVISRARVMTSMKSVSVTDTVKIGTNFEISGVHVSRLVRGLTDAYTYTTNSSTIKSEKFKIKQEIPYAVSEHIEIPPCSEYSVTSYAKMIQGYTIDYVLHAKIRGQKGRRSMTTTELRDELQGMDYVEDYDDSTIIAKANGTIVSDLGLEAVIDGEGYSIVGCQNKIIRNRV